MEIQVQIPDDVAQVLCRNGGTERLDLPHALLEALALEGYRTRQLSESQVRRLLKLDTRMEVHAFLKAHGVPLDYSMGDLEQDLAAIAGFEGTPAPQAG